MSEEPTSRPRSRNFTTTRWTLILQAGDPANPKHREALEDLCLKYWHPVYAFIRRQGYPQEKAEDLTQGFFSVFVEKGYAAQADHSRGRFRTFLLVSVKHYIANEWKRSRSRKRGGRHKALNLDFREAERFLTLDGASPATPEEIFTQRWAESLLRQTLDRMEQEMTRVGQGNRFEQLKPALIDGKTVHGNRQAARELGLTEAAVKTAIHRMRRRFGQLLRAEIADTVLDEGEIDEEIRYLFEALSS